MAASDFVRRDPLAGRQYRAHRTDPLWARWNDELDQPYALGLEEQVMLLHPHRWSLAQSSDQMLAKLSSRLSPNVSSETDAGVLAIVTGIHPDVGGIAGELASLRARLRHELSSIGLTAAAAGMHPLSRRTRPKVPGTTSTKLVGGLIGMVARWEPTMAVNVHLSVPAPNDAVRVLNALRRCAPVLLALSANSPFAHGEDRGFASSRTLVLRASPRTGLPRCFACYRDYVDALDPLVVSRAVPDASHVRWDIRLQPTLASVEVRLMDAQSTVSEIAPLLALIQSLARMELESESSPCTPSAEVLSENCFLAARDGMSASLIEQAASCLVPVREMLNELLAECRPHALALGCAGTLDQVQRLAVANGADRQRAFALASGSLERLVPRLADRFLAPTWPITTPSAEYQHA